ncbi:MAG: hypothetical protein DBW93_01045 [SAR86 cluster bacterium]|nr:MAG: hypothetical protein DBW93_01045 [SAR86 cluster bacterium]
MNILSVDLTKKEHFIALNYENNEYCFEFQTNDWSEKIDTLHKIENFDFQKLDCSAYAAGPGSFTGARLAFTFLNTLKFIYDIEMFAFSNLAAMNWLNDDKIPLIIGNNNDFYYRENKTDFYTQDLKKVESLKNNLVMIEGSNAYISPKLLIQRNQVAINIINMIASKSNSNLDSNEPNYVKSLTYRKINE